MGQQAEAQYSDGVIETVEQPLEQRQHTVQRATRRRAATGAGLKAFGRWLWPLADAPKGIAALDGLRAVAALSIVAFHTLLYMQFEYTPFSHAIGGIWYNLASGVPLFFVLSGFLLFLPYARSMLYGKSFPSTWGFYQRRALRILPAYYVCLFIVAPFRAPSPIRPLWQNIGVHLLFIHDDFPLYNRDLNGPFWTLAVEWQFYILLPLIAFGLARLVGASRSLPRLIGWLIALIIGIELLRVLDAWLMIGLPMNASSDTLVSGIQRTFVLITMGMQGKYLEIFAVGMLCSALYVWSVEHKQLGEGLRRRLGYGLLMMGVGFGVLSILDDAAAAALFTPGLVWGPDIILYPLITGLAYGALLLGVLWGGGWLRTLLETPLLRFLGFMSFSLYLWHLPIIHADIPLFAPLSLPLRLVGVFVVSYLSYQLVERFFLRRKGQLARERPEFAVASDSPAASPPANAAPHSA
ncbi:MAG: acyltransferase [Ktedonobacterales bacterium]